MRHRAASWITIGFLIASSIGLLISVLSPSIMVGSPSWWWSAGSTGAVASSEVSDAEENLVALRETVHEETGLMLNQFNTYWNMIKWVGAVLIGTGVFSLLKVTDFEKKAAALLDKKKAEIEELLDGAKRQIADSLKQAQEAAEIHNRMKSAWEGLPKRLERLPRIPDVWTVGTPRSVDLPEALALVEDADSVLVVCDTIGGTALSDKKMAKYYRRLGEWWCFLGEHGKAQARLQRAVECRDGWRNQCQLALILGVVANEGAGLSEDSRTELLTRARSHLRHAKMRRKYEPARIASVEAWLHDEEGAYDDAVQGYKRAIQLAETWDYSQAELSLLMLRTRYNLACTHAKDGNYESARDALEDVLVEPHIGERLEHAKRDPDLNGFWRSSIGKSFDSSLQSQPES